jgi:hypothetical protein
LNPSQPNRFIEKRYTIPTDVLAAGGSVVIKFVAEPGSLAGGIYELRLMRPSP